MGLLDAYPVPDRLEADSIECPFMAGSGRREVQTRRRKPVLQRHAAVRLSSAAWRAACGRDWQL